MGAHARGRRLAGSLLLAFLMLMAAPAASALAVAKVRLVNARPGSQALRLSVGGSAVGPASFGQATPYASAGSGSVRLELSGGASANSTEDLVDGAHYTAVVLAKGASGAQLKLYRDGAAAGGRARLRVIHAAPELGSPNIRLGKRTIAEDVAFREATPYLSVAPGSYTLAVVRPGSSQAILGRRVSLAAGSSTTAVLAGSGGARERLIVATDQNVTPAGAPETGFGGLADGGGRNWLLVALAALAAGVAGGLAQLSLARRGRR